MYTRSKTGYIIDDIMTSVAEKRDEENQLLPSSADVSRQCQSARGKILKCPENEIQVLSGRTEPPFELYKRAMTPTTLLLM